jgi:microcystin degradation protein MlrC
VLGVYRIGIGGFVHETHTFCPAPTDIPDFEGQKGVRAGQEIIDYYRGTTSYIGGYLEILKDYDVEIIPTSDARAGVNNYVTKAAFDKYANAIAHGLGAAGKLDAVLLALHGAMVSEEFPKAEAEIVRRVRKAVGDIPVFVTLDLHANEDHELTDVADAVFVCKKYPHTDTRECGRAAAKCLMLTLQGKFNPTMAIARPGILSPSVFQWTGAYPMKMFREIGDGWEKKEKDVYYQETPQSRAIHRRGHRSCGVGRDMGGKANICLPYGLACCIIEP